MYGAANPEHDAPGVQWRSVCRHANIPSISKENRNNTPQRSLVVHSDAMSVFPNRIFPHQPRSHQRTCVRSYKELTHEQSSMLTACSSPEHMKLTRSSCCASWSTSASMSIAGRASYVEYTTPLSTVLAATSNALMREHRPAC